MGPFGVKLYEQDWLGDGRRERAMLRVTLVQGDVTEAADDDALLVACAQVDSSAFAPLYDRYIDAVYRYCERRLGHRAAAEDATSIIFTRAFVNLPQFQAGSFRGWLFTIAHHVVVDEYRRVRPVAPLEVADGTADSAPTPEELAIDAEAAESVRALLARLSPDQRQVVELRLAGLTGEEIVRVLGRSRGAVDALAYRAMTRLRGLLVERTTEGEVGR
jgi:RNA polymerase sigma-70 factor (ECF subfamily)